jgi:hypothetical protein
MAFPAVTGLKVCTESGWFAARPSGTEDVYKIYAESVPGRRAPLAHSGGGTRGRRRRARLSVIQGVYAVAP